MQTLDILEDRLPLPQLSERDFGKFTQEEMQGIYDAAVEYQRLADMLMEHPALKYLIEENKGMDATRA